MKFGDNNLNKSGCVHAYFCSTWSLFVLVGAKYIGGSFFLGHTVVVVLCRYFRFKF